MLAKDKIEAFKDEQPDENILTLTERNRLFGRIAPFIS